MILMMVGFMGSAAFIFSSSRVMPMIDNATMAISSWFHLNTHIIQSALHTGLLKTCYFFYLFLFFAAVSRLKRCTGGEEVMLPNLCNGGNTELTPDKAPPHDQLITHWRNFTHHIM